MLDDELGTLVRRAERAEGSASGLSPHALAGLLDAIADRPDIWRSCVRHEPSCRWYGSLYRDAVVDLWLITWQQENRTDLHDHGGSCGAFRVLEGVLTEDRPKLTPDTGRSTLSRSRRSVGQTVSFGRRLVHDVHNLSVVPAVSLHLYSPPLTSMTYYDLDRGTLSPRYTEPVEVRPSDGPVPERAATVLV